MDQPAETSTTARPRRAEAIFTATLELLATAGYEGLTMESVALRAGVNKTTLYRWWKSKDEVLAAALTESDLLTFPVPDTGSLRSDLIETARSIHGLLTDAATAPIAAAVLAASPGRPSLAAVGRMFFTDRAAREHALFHRAAERGELDETTDPRLVMDMLAGSIWFRLFLRAEPVAAADIEAAVDMVLDGITAQRREPTGRRARSGARHSAVRAGPGERDTAGPSPEQGQQLREQYQDER